MLEETRVYIKGTTETPVERNFGGAPATFRHYHPKEKLYYKKEGKYYCSVDDKSARGFIIRTPEGEERFLPHDYDDLITYEEAFRLCKESGVFFPKPNHKRDGKRTPPPLITIRSPKRQRPAWNRSAILRHIDECNRRKNNA